MESIIDSGTADTLGALFSKFLQSQEGAKLLEPILEEIDKKFILAGEKLVAKFETAEKNLLDMLERVESKIDVVSAKQEELEERLEDVKKMILNWMSSAGI